MRHMVFHAQDNQLNASFSPNRFARDLELAQIGKGTAALALDASVSLKGLQGQADQANGSFGDDRLLHVFQSPKNGKYFAARLLDTGF
eukprot:Skav231985  [mRNA]  locus=scaffold719:209423:211346:+ [translate_table: standard]